MKDWKHQVDVVKANVDAFDIGYRRWCYAAPPGAGKTHIACMMIKRIINKGLKVHIVPHRIMLTEQLSGALSKSGIDHGIIAADNSFDDRYDITKAVQITQNQTVSSRLRQGAKFDYPRADVVFVDECHAQKGDQTKKLFEVYKAWGSTIVGMTATPVGLGDFYQGVIQKVKYKDLLACGAHLPVICYGPNFPDPDVLKSMPKNGKGEFSGKELEKLFKQGYLIGSIFDNWKKHNPDARPTLCYGPSVDGSKYLAQSFYEKGVPVCHIDSEYTIFTEKNSNGVLEWKSYTTDGHTRKRYLAGIADGTFKVGFNRFILREAIDIPELYCLIFATSVHRVDSFLQMSGRVLRNHASLNHVIVIDHGANIDMHGLPNEERFFTAGCTARSLYQERKEKIQRSKEYDAEPIICPKCNAYRLSGKVCNNCGHKHIRSARMVLQSNGELVRKTGRATKYKRVKDKFSDFYTSSVFAMARSGGLVCSAHRIAMEKLIATTGEAPDEIGGGRIKLYGPMDPEWRMPAAEVYPWAAKKG